MSRIIDGRLISAAVKERVKNEVAALKAYGVTVGLAVIIVGDDPASKIYVANKKKACEALGIVSEEYVLPESTTEEELLSLIKTLNNKKSINGILCQLPLPKGLNEKLIINSISPEKDVDAFQPMAMLLLHANGTVTVCHSKTENLKDICRTADILVAAVGKPRFVTADMVKAGAVVIDVGMNRENGKLCGDVDFEGVKDKAFAITPVPGGVGPMTIAMLMQNTLTAAKRQNNIRR